MVGTAVERKSGVAKVKSPLKSARLEMDLSRSELASLIFPSRDDHVVKAELAQEIALCEAGLCGPGGRPTLRLLFDALSVQGYKDLRDKQNEWISARKKAVEQG